MENLMFWILGCLILTSSCNGSVEEIVEELQRELQHLKTKTTTHEKESQQLINEMQALKMKTASYENEIQQLKTKTASYENEIQALKTSSAKEIQALKKTSAIDFQALEASSIRDVKLIKEEINALKADTIIGPVTSQRRFVRGANLYAEKPAFSASLSNHATGLGNFQTIVFDHVFTNDLSGYSGLTGIFTAPMNGTYFFTATVMSHNGDHVETEITLNGNVLVKMYSYDTHYEQGTNSVVLVLKTGDKVWVRHHNTEGTKAYGNHWSSFSGFMI